MAEERFEFRVTLAGQPGSELAAIIDPFDVQETFGLKARVPVRATINGFSVSIFADADGWMLRDGGE